MPSSALWIPGTSSHQSKKLSFDVYDVKALTHIHFPPICNFWSFKQIKFSAGSSCVTIPQPSGHPSHSCPLLPSHSQILWAKQPWRCPRAAHVPLPPQATRGPTDYCSVCNPDSRSSPCHILGGCPPSRHSTQPPTHNTINTVRVRAGLRTGRCGEIQEGTWTLKAQREAFCDYNQRPRSLKIPTCCTQSCPDHQMYIVNMFSRLLVLRERANLKTAHWLDYSASLSSSLLYLLGQTGKKFWLPCHQYS